MNIDLHQERETEPSARVAITEDALGPPLHTRSVVLDLALKAVSRTRIPAAAACLFGYLAAFGPQSANAAFPWQCCNLARSNWCQSGPPGGPRYLCDQGHAKTWYCCSNNVLFGCGECTSGVDCHHGTFYCSYGFEAGYC